MPPTKPFIGIDLGGTNMQLGVVSPDGKLLAQTERSAAEDIDMVQALSDFQQRQTSYDAALRAYASVQKLSLFDYIR